MEGEAKVGEDTSFVRKMKVELGERGREGRREGERKRDRQTDTDFLGRVGVLLGLWILRPPPSRWLHVLSFPFLASLLGCLENYQLIPGLKDLIGLL